MPRPKEEAQRLGIRIMPPGNKPHRRKSWNNYFQPGRYGITLHIFQYEDGSVEQCSLLGEIVGSCRNERYLADGSTNPGFPHISLSPVGKIVEYKLGMINSYEDYRHVRIINCVIMPTHIHVTLEIESQLPVKTYANGNSKQLTLGDMVRGFKQGTTSLYKRWLNGEFDPGDESSDDWREKASQPASSYVTIPGGYSFLRDDIAATSLWEANYHDIVLYNTYALSDFINYVNMNPYRWKARDEFPHLFEHRLHIAIEGTDYSAWGCMFLLRIPRRRAVMCHRLARKGMLTQAEWARLVAPISPQASATSPLSSPTSPQASATSPQASPTSPQASATSPQASPAGSQPPFNTSCSRPLTDGESTEESHIKDYLHYERLASTRSLGHYDRDWLTSSRPDCITPVPYTETEAFRLQKEELLKQAATGTILVSPAISPGEKDIIYSALAAHHKVIKLRNKPFTSKSHPTETDINYCSQGTLLVIAPWEIPDTLSLNQQDEYGKMTKYSAFHNLNELAQRLCNNIDKMTWALA